MRKTIFLLIVILIACMGSSVSSQEDTDLDKTERAIYTLVKVNPQHILYRSEEARKNVAEALVNASEVSGISWPILVGQSFYESSFRENVKGKLGEVGIFQLLGQNKIDHCEAELNRKVDINKVEDQAFCGALWMKKCINYCKGDLKYGLTLYATGKYCKPIPGTEWEYKLAGRMNMFKKIASM